MRRIVLFAFGLAALVAAVACGGGGGDGGSATSAAPTSTPGGSASTSTVSGGTSATPGGAASVIIKDFEFTPSSISVAVGTTVTWTNEGNMSHTVTSDSGGELDSGDMGKGKSYSHTFTKAGTYDYHCTIHPFMKAKVVVQ